VFSMSPQAVMRLRREAGQVMGELSELLRSVMSPEQRAREAALRRELSDREAQLKQVTAGLMDAQAANIAPSTTTMATSLVAAVPAALPAAVGSRREGQGASLADQLGARLRALLAERDAALASSLARQAAVVQKELQEAGREAAEAEERARRAEAAAAEAERRVKEAHAQAAALGAGDAGLSQVRGDEMRCLRVAPNCWPYIVWCACLCACICVCEGRERGASSQPSTGVGGQPTRAGGQGVLSWQELCCSWSGPVCILVVRLHHSPISCPRCGRLRLSGSSSCWPRKPPPHTQPMTDSGWRQRSH
jgi:hypothetical protein